MITRRYYIMDDHICSISDHAKSNHTESNITEPLGWNSKAMKAVLEVTALSAATAI